MTKHQRLWAAMRREATRRGLSVRETVLLNATREAQRIIGGKK